MKLTKSQANGIAEKYDLGKLKSIELIEDGMINQNYFLNTDKGEFVLRFLRKNPDNTYLADRDLEFSLIKFLFNSRFPYSIPFPIVSSVGESVSFLEGRRYWVYPKISGEKFKKLSLAQTKSIAKAIAIYHRYVSKINLKSSRKSMSSQTWLLNEYSKMAKISPKSEVDRLMLKNLALFRKALEDHVKLKFRGKLIPIHGDFHQSNLLFHGDNVCAILDFDNVRWSLKSRDLAICIKSVCVSKSRFMKERFEYFLQEYRKHNSLSDREVSYIIPLIIRNYCNIFWWGYKGYLKDEAKRKKVMERAINQIKFFLEAER